MNAYQLADELEKLSWINGDETLSPYKAQANMLRLQADYIKKLETKYQQEFEYVENLLKEQQKWNQFHTTQARSRLAASMCHQKLTIWARIASSSRVFCWACG